MASNRSASVFFSQAAAETRVAAAREACDRVRDGVVTPREPVFRTLAGVNGSLRSARFGSDNGTPSTSKRSA